jgi:LCP family protein required for cell wall assembly
MMSHYALHHVSDANLVAYVHHQLTDAQREEIDRHLETCLECRRQLMSHADVQRRLSDGLTRELAQLHPISDWATIAPRMHKPHQSRGLVPGWLRGSSPSRRATYVAMLVAYAIVLVLGGIFVFTVIRDMVQEQKTVSLVADRSTATPAPTPVLGGASITTVPTPEPTPALVGPPVWDGEGRVNLLVLGIDQRGSQGGYFRTDTMIIVSVDPKANSVGMISVPRDLWVPIWGYDIENRINTAHYYGDARAYPGGGPALARDTVAYNLGIPIHHYIRLNFSAFEKLIDEIGGIDLYVEKTINDPLYPDEGTGYDPFYLPAGQHHLDGEIALKYARSRHGTGDFDRAQRQQQVILAARDQVVRLNQLPRLIANGPDILNTLGDSVRTDLSFDQAVQLAQIVNAIPLEAYRGAVIDQSYTQPYTTDSGAQVLIPLRDKIATLYESFFTGP